MAVVVDTRSTGKVDPSTVTVGASAGASSTVRVGAVVVVVVRLSALAPLDRSFADVRRSEPRTSPELFLTHAAQTPLWS
ncbi:MAG TPA: hypothetical protein ENI86_15910, partial [Acidimicrobiales bacterium]|nr:hypothetical protein [Acidimicrobiales bacterium]